MIVIPLPCAYSYLYPPLQDVDNASVLNPVIEFLCRVEIKNRSMNRSYIPFFHLAAGYLAKGRQVRPICNGGRAEFPLGFMVCQKRDFSGKFPLNE